MPGSSSRIRRTGMNGRRSPSGTTPRRRLCIATRSPRWPRARAGIKRRRNRGLATPITSAAVAEAPIAPSREIVQQVTESVEAIRTAVALGKPEAISSTKPKSSRTRRRSSLADDKRIMLPVQSRRKRMFFLGNIV